MTTTTVAGGDAVRALQPFADLPDWLAALMQPGRLQSALRRQVPELADGRLELLDGRSDRLRAKGDEWLARCRVTVARPGGEPREVVLVGQLVPPGRTSLGPPSPRATDRAFDPGWRVQLPELGLFLRVQETDEALPALAVLLDAQAAARTIESCLQAGAYPGVVVTSCVPNVVRYKPGSRCTIVYEMHYASEGSGRRLPDPVVAKTHQGDKGLMAHDAMTALWRTDLARGDVVTLAEPLGFLPQERVLLQGPVPEDRTLKELARQAFTDGSPAGFHELRRQLEGTARALAALHSSGARYPREASWADELAEVREVLDRLSGSVPGLDEAAEPMLSDLEALDALAPADPVVSAHHDFRPAQVLLHDGRVGFIDFDGASMAEPALDLGRFRAKLRDIGISALAASGQPLAGDPLHDRLLLLDELCEYFLTAYRRWAPVTRERVLLWETTDLLTALLHTWTKVRLLRVAPRLAVLVHQLRTHHTAPGSAAR